MLGSLPNWNAMMDGYKLFGRDILGRRNVGVALYAREYLDVIELGNDNDNVESLWVRTGRRPTGLTS